MAVWNLHQKQEKRGIYTAHWCEKFEERLVDCAKNRTGCCCFLLMHFRDTTEEMTRNLEFSLTLIYLEFETALA